MSKYRKKPVVIEARQLSPDNHQHVANWIAGSGYEVRHASKPPMRAVTGLVIKTLEGDMAADYGDWIIKGVAGEFYPCKPDIFEATYDAVVSAGDTDPDPAPAQLHSWFSKAALDVTAERRRQIEAEGYGNRHDDAHTSFEITKAAVAYAQRAAMSDDVRAFKEKRDHVPGLWPWARAWWKPKGRRADLVRAAALLIAEIERLDRAEAKS